MSDVTATEILDALESLHSEGWVFFREMRCGTAYHVYSEQRMDAWAINAWPSKRAGKVKAPHIRRAFEVKVNSADVLDELRNPDKRWFAKTVSHEFYFVAPKGMIDKKNLEKDEGLMEYDPEKKTLHTVKAPRVREAVAPRWNFVAGICRRIKDYEIRRTSAIIAGLIEQIGDMHTLIEESNRGGGMRDEG